MPLERAAQEQAAVKEGGYGEVVWFHLTSFILCLFLHTGCPFPYLHIISLFCYRVNYASRV